MRRKSKRNKALIIIIIIVLTFLILGSFAYLNYSGKKEVIINENDVLENDEDEVETVYPITESFSLLATGDALIHNVIFYQYASRDYDFTGIFSEVTDYINQFDVKYINQETVFADGAYSGYPLFNTPSSWGDAMIYAGFNLFSLATNHSYDMFSSGAFDNVSYWKSQIGVGYAGMNDSSEREYYITNVNGITYGFLSYTEHTNGLSISSDYSYLVDVYSEELAQSDIDYLRDLVDVVIVAMHWGTEYTSEPNTFQKETAQDLADMGVDIILGNHPHWIQPIEYIGDTLVIYSMGNFISNQISLISSSYYTESVAVGAMVSMDVNKVTYETGESEVYTDNINVELIYSYRASNGDYFVIPFSKMDETYNSDYITIYEKHKERITMYSDLVNVNPL